MGLLGFQDWEGKKKGRTFKEIRIEFRGVYDEPGLAFLEIRTEFTILRRERTYWTT